MLSVKQIAVLAALCGVTASCQVDPIEIPAEELYAREFIKSFGLVSPDQDWSVVKRSSITVTSSTPTDVRIMAIVNGKTYLLGYYTGVSGTRTLGFDCPKQTEEVLVKGGACFEKVALGGEISLSALPASRATDGTDRLPGYSIKNGYYWGSKYVEAIQKVLPEGKSQNIASTKTVSDFSFVSTGREFVIYPVYWQTTANDVLGVYWYENGQMKTMDIFDNKVMVEDTPYHNIYRRATQGANLVVMTSDPADGATDVSRNGTITLTFNRDVEMLSSHKATLSEGVLGSPVIGDDNRTVTYSYSDTGHNSKVKFTLSGSSFKANDNAPGDLKTALNETYTLTFTTADNSPKWTRTVYNIDASGLAGDIVIYFTQPVVLGGGTATLSPDAQLGTPVVSADGMYVTIPFSGCAYSTTYTLSLGDGFVAGADGSVVAMGAFASENSFTTVEAGQNVEYEEEKHYLDYSALGLSVLANGRLAHNGAEIKSAVTLMSEPMEFSIMQKNANAILNVPDVTGYDFGDGLTFGFGLPMLQTSNDMTKIVTCESVKAGACQLNVVPKHNMLLTLYSVVDVATDTIPLMAAVESATVISPYSKQLRSGLGTVTYALRENIGYTIYFPKDCSGIIAGVAYQLASDDVQPSGKPRRVVCVNPAGCGSSRAGDDTGGVELGTNGKIPDFWVDGQEPGNGFTRELLNKSAAVSKDGLDEVLTHRVAFTLPKGVIFGFYVRNNNGATRITGESGAEKPYTNYSMSSLNEEMPNSFFNVLDPSLSEYGYFNKGWGSKISGQVHGSLKSVTVPAGRKYSTASTYTVEVNGQEMRYFSFEDWVDCDFNDIAFMVAPESADVDIVDGDVETNPYIFAVEDLGATTTSDIDFNDVVFAVEHVAGSDYAFVTMLAAGGTLRSELCYEGRVIDGHNFGEIVGGPLAGSGSTLRHVNEWFGVSDHNHPINIGSAGKSVSFGSLTTVKIPVDASTFTLTDADKAQAAAGRLLGFSVKVDREDGVQTSITRPDAKGQTPQMIILPGTWAWPLEGVAISEAYPGGISYDGTYLPSFETWVNGGDGQGYQNAGWHESPSLGRVLRHPWNGSEAAREHFRGQGE